MQFVQSFTLVASSLLFMYMAHYSYTHRKMPGAFAFSILMTVTLIWSLGSFFELQATTLQGKIIWRNIEQIGVFGVPITTVYFAMIFTRHQKSLKYVLLAAIPQLVSVVLIFTNELHHLMRIGCALEESGTFGKSLVVHSTTLGSVLVAYNFVLPLIAVGILLNYMRKLSPGFRRQVGIIIFCFLYTFVVAWIKTAFLEQLGIYMHIAVLYAPAALVMLLSLFKYRLFSLSPIARDKVFDVINQGILVMDENGMIIDANAYAISVLDRHFGVPNPLGAKLEDINTKYPEINRVIGRTQEEQLEIRAANGAENAYISLNYYPLYHHKDKYIGSVVIFTNITVQKLFERNLKEKAEKDYLTRFLNKFGFQKALQKYLSDGNRRRYAVLMMDIDHFKQINDSFGHAAGDEILRSFTGVVNGIIRSEDIAGRFGGDEFVIVVPSISSDTALQIAERIRQTVEEKQIEVNKHIIRYTISTGIADSGAAAQSFDDVLRNADQALYEAKSRSRNCSVVFTQKNE